MTLTITTPPVPLTTNADGVVLVTGTRVPMDTIVLEFKQGATAEAIAEQYSSLNLLTFMLSLAITCDIKMRLMNICNNVNNKLKKFVKKMSDVFPQKGCAIDC